MTAAATLIFGWGNPSRGDDALGPRLIDGIEQLCATHPEWGAVECLTDFQLQIEHALDLLGRRRVLFVDASADGRDEDRPFRVTSVAPARDGSFTTHALSPEAVLQVYADLNQAPPPPCQLLAITGESFALGADLSDRAAANLAAALEWTGAWLAESPHILFE